MATFMENKHPQDWANLVFAILLFISPWVFGFSADRLVAGNAWICGIIIAALAIGALSAFQEWEEWLNLLVGIWVVVSPWVLGFAAMTNVRWTNVVLGILVIIAAAWEIWEVRHRPHAA
jgi:SPW repeat-containing protein